MTDLIAVPRYGDAVGSIVVILECGHLFILSFEGASYYRGLSVRHARIDCFDCPLGGHRQRITDVIVRHD
jgi:hypothetical protein